MSGSSLMFIFYEVNSCYFFKNELDEVHKIVVYLMSSCVNWAFFGTSRPF
jgi:hypothetical protein